MDKYKTIIDDIIMGMDGNNHIYYDCTVEMEDDEFFKELQLRLHNEGFVISRNKKIGVCFVTRRTTLFDWFLILIIIILIAYIALHM
jgi:hypothetical protein